MPIKAAAEALELVEEFFKEMNGIVRPIPKPDWAEWARAWRAEQAQGQVVELTVG